MAGHFVCLEINYDAMNFLPDGEWLRSTIRILFGELIEFARFWNEKH